MCENRLVVQKVFVDLITGEVIAKPGDVLDSKLLYVLVCLKSHGYLRILDNKNTLEEYHGAAS